MSHCSICVENLERVTFLAAALSGDSKRPADCNPIVQSMSSNNDLMPDIIISTNSYI